MSRIEIAGILDGNPMFGSEQHPADEIQALLGTDGHQNLVRARLDAARGQQMLADHVDQHRVVRTDAVLEARVGVG